MRNPGHVVDDYMSFIDFAAKFIELAGIKWRRTGMAASAGRNLTDIFKSTRSGQGTSTRDHVLIGKERHDVGRPHDRGHLIWGIVKADLLYLHNFETSCRPAANPETSCLNCDGSATKTKIWETIE